MGHYDIKNHFPYSVVPAKDGKVVLTLEIEAIHVKTFLTMLESLSDFFRIVNSKARSALALSRLPDTQAKGEELYQKYCEFVINGFRKTQKESGFTLSESISIISRP